MSSFLGEVRGAGAGRWWMLLVAVAVIWHLVAVLAPPSVPPPKDSAGRDFASYYYAARVAHDGGDPYDKAQLEALARADGTRNDVHPFFYPPPFLWLVAWAPAVDLQVGFQIWWLLNELCLLAVCLVLALWWRPLGEHVGVVVALVAATMYAVVYSAELGQANFPVLLAVLVGLATERRWPVLAGVAVGLAAMWKMSPALVVAWWLLHRRWPAVAAAVGTAIGSTLLTLPLLGAAPQLGFYRDVLPGLQRGEYNGLVIQIGMFANHSVPNLLHQAFPSGGNVLSALARGSSTAFQVLLVGTLGWWFRVPTHDPVRLAAQGSAVLVAALLVPVYTYEHHLVFAIPAIVLSVLAVGRGWVPRAATLPVALAVAVLVFDLPTLRQFAQRVVTERMPVPYFLLQEAKFAALVTVGAVAVRIGATALEDRSRPPPPRPA
jgi:hypothetical protein